MKRTALLLLATAMLFSCNNNSDDKSKSSGTDTAKNTTASTDNSAKKPDAPAAPMDSASMMKAWAEYSTPGDMHKMMASWNGTWSEDISMYEPGKEPQKSTGTVTNKMVMGGRYQEAIHNSTMMGQPFEGHSTLGWDNIRKMFESTWIDNMGTGVMKVSGPWDAATKTITLSGPMMDFTTGKETNFKEVLKVVDDNTQHVEMYGTGPDGKEWKMMEIHLTRKK